MKKETYCLACRKYTKNNNPKIVRNNQNKLMIQSNCANCAIKTPLSKVPLLNILFEYSLKR